MRNPLTFLLATIGLIGALGLAACQGGRIQPVYVDSAYNPLALRSLPYREGFRLDIAGNPFAMDATAFAAAINAAVQPAGAEPMTTGPRVHLAFTDSPAADSRSACSAPGQAGFARSGEIGTVFALCSGDSVLSYTTGRIAKVESADDPHFRNFLRQGVRSLFPGRTEDWRRDRETNCLIGPDC